MLTTDRLLSNGALCLSLSVPRQRRSLLDEVDEARLQKSHQHRDGLGLVAWRFERFQADAQTTLALGHLFGFDWRPQRHGRRTTREHVIVRV